MNAFGEAPDQPRQTSVKGVVLAADDSDEARRNKMARIILDSMYQFLGLLDVDGTVLEINRAALNGAGLSLQDVIGKPFWRARWWAISQEARNRVQAMIAEARTGKFVRCDFEVYGEMQGHKTIVIDFSLTPILDDDGNVAFLLPEGRNISEKIAIGAELKRRNGELQTALEKLKEIDGFKAKFFANVSHELRTPLALILGPVDQLLREGKGLGERDKFRLTTIRRNAQSLLQQVNDLLDLARVDADRMPLAYVNTCVTGMAREIAAAFAAAADERAITLSVRGDDDLLADIDRAKFARILANLLSNAFKFTPDGGRISCTTERIAGSRFLLCVRDNGPGVPAHLQRQIFERFVQGEDPRGTTGSGLGLNIVREFAELHGGTVAVVDAPGGGAAFQVELPLHAPAGTFVRESAEETVGYADCPHNCSELAIPQPAADRPEKPRILIVEDNPDLRLFLYDVLVDDYNVTVEADGASALARAVAAPPDLIITDLMMPHFDGERFLRELRSAPDFPNVPVLVLSAHADDSLRESLLEELVQDYLSKPFSPQELRARVRNLVAVKCTVDILQKELNSQASDIRELTSSLVESRKFLQRSLLALQISDRRWQGLYENTAVGIALADREGRILSANPALQRMIGYGNEEIVGVSLIEITEESQRALTEWNVHELVDGTLPGYHIQKRYEKKGGGLLWGNVCASRIPAIDQQGPMMAVIVEDITSRKLAEQSLAETRSELMRVSRFTAMGELVASIAHEVNQPLSAIITNSGAALRWIALDKPNYEEVVAALQRTNQAAMLAGQVIARIRKFLRAGEIRREPLAVPRLLDELLVMLQGMLTDAGVRVEQHIAPALPEPLADHVQMQQVLLNLILNAVEAMREKREGERLLTLSADPDGVGGVILAVADSGPGVQPGTEEKLFETFFSTKQNGLGMGLAISRTIVENHGGRLWLDGSTAVGARFIFTIPAV